MRARLDNRWVILAVLFAVRLTMGFQFQSVAAVAPLLGREFGFGLADIGILIGLYFAPGVALSLPGGALGKKFGDKAITLAGLMLMLVGSLVMASSASWSGQVAGRLISGAGGVIMNVQMTKMVTDWFAGREIATAMAIFVNSWPAGVAMALLTLPLIGTVYGIGATFIVVAALIGCGTVLLLAAYQAPRHSAGATTAATPLQRNTIMAVVVAGAIWALYNVGFATIFSFGPSMLVERGWSIASAGSAISIVMWLAVFSVPFGGFLADRTKRPELVLVAGCVTFALLMVMLPRSGAATLLTVIALGLVCGQPAGPIMSLPARVLQPATRGVGMGIFYTVFYAAMMLGPAIAGACAKWAGSAGAALDFGAAMVLACPVILWCFNRIPGAVRKTA